jgi:hypothetical protein
MGEQVVVRFEVEVVARVFVVLAAGALKKDLVHHTLVEVAFQGDKPDIRMPEGATCVEEADGILQVHQTEGEDTDNYHIQEVAAGTDAWEGTQETAATVAEGQ